MYTYDLETTTAGRRVPTEFALLAFLIYTLLVSQIWGAYVPKPNEIISTHAVVTSTKVSDNFNKNAGISKFIDEIPLAEVDSETVEMVKAIETAKIAEAVETVEITEADETAEAVETAVAEEIDTVEITEATEEAEPTETKKIQWEEGCPFPENSFSEEENIALAILIEGEARDQASLTEFSAPGWCVINRIYYSGCPDNIMGVITQDGQFDGYTEGGRYSERSLWMAHDILARYERELAGEEEVGRTLPKEYLFFYGDGDHNYFSITEGGAAYVWGSSLESPYET